MNKHILLFALLSATIVSSYAETVDDSPIVVRAKRSTTPHLNGGPKNVITQSKIRSTGYTTIQQTLQRYGNMQITSASGSSNQATINLRGFGANASSNSLVLINGVPLTNPDLAPPNLNVIPTSDISRIEVVSGSESVLYGDQAVGGVVNIVTNDLTSPATRFACHGGSYNNYGCDAGYGNTFRDLSYHVSGAADHTDNYRDHNQDDQQHADIAFNQPYANGYVRADINILNENIQYPGALTAAQVQQDREQATNSTDYFRDTNGSIQLLDHHNFSNDWTLESVFSTTHMSGRGVLSSDFTQARSSYFLKPTLKGRVKDSAVTVGSDYQHDYYRLASAYGLTEDSQQKFGLFSIAAVPLQPRLTLNVGARGAEQTSRLISTDTNNNLNRALATTIGTSYQLTPESSWYVRRAGSFRFPKADENAFTEPGSTGLRTQRGISYETGWQYANDTASLNIDAFVLNIKDEIAYDPLQTPTTPFGSNQNLSPTTRRGASLSGSDKLIDNITADAQFNLLSATFQNGVYANKHIPLVANNLFHAGLQYDVTEQWHTYAEAVYTGPQYAANDYANVAGKLGGYTTYDCNVQYTRKQFTAALHLNNIFNKYYYFYSAYQSGDTYFFPAPTRNIMLTLEYALT